MKITVTALVQGSPGFSAHSIQFNAKSVPEAPGGVQNAARAERERGRTCAVEAFLVHSAEMDGLSLQNKQERRSANCSSER
jgi:hypothetical protein